MALLADGITQLQKAMLKQYDKSSEGEKSPQNIKPGTSVLPVLKDATADTSCVDIMDWMELIDAEGEKSPQNIKPGTSVLPVLKDATADTSCVDIMDWMELIDAPMSDLSDGSAVWWRKVVKEAHRAYGVW
eukprot:s854_g3.t1